jgi:AAA15 family ATPase/GTPase
VIYVLHWFRFDNCYSFKDDRLGENDKPKNGISMMARETDESASSFIPTFRGAINIWQVASIYGPNASGKSNILRALSDVFYNIAGTNPNLRGECFLFDYEAKDKPIFSEICFSLLKPSSFDEHIEYTYGYKLSTCESSGRANVVLSEWLKMRNLGSNEAPVDVFTRDENSNPVFYGDFENSEAENQLVNELEKLTDDERSKKLLMRLVGEGSVSDKMLNSIFNWCMKVIPPEFFTEEDGKWQISRIAERVAKSLNVNNPKFNEKYKDKYLEFMQKFDTGINNIKPNNKFDLITEHTMQNVTAGNKQFCERSIYQESYGTQKIAGIYQYFLNAITNGGLLIIDEFDIKLHPWVIRDLVALLHNEDINKKNDEKAQLIFSAHNVAVLNLDYVHMDEVYFVDKDKNEKSIIYRLDKRSLNEDDLKEGNIDLAELYLNKYKFGAIPKTKLEI